MTIKRIATLTGFVFSALVHAQVSELKLDPAFNPVVLTSTTPEITRSASRLGVSDCRGYVSEQPAAVVDIPRGSSDIAITVNGLDLLVVLADNGTFWCANAAAQSAGVRPGHWPGGKARVFVGPLDQTSKDPKRYQYTLVAEDVARPLALGWGAADTTVLDGKLAEPIKVQVGAGALRDYGFKLHGCGGSTATQPSHYFEVKRPFADASLFVATGDKDARAILVGPLTGDRNLESRCLGRGVTQVSSQAPLKPGRYALLGGHAEGKQAALALVIADRDTRRDPLSFGGVAAGLPPEQRSINPYMPFWSAEQDGQLRAFAPLVQELLAVAPRELFVFARFDLDGSSLDLDDSVIGERGFPRKGEPVLLYGSDRPRALAADGSTYTLKGADLFAPEPVGPVFLPAEARNTSYEFSLKHTATDGRVMMGGKKPDPKDPAFVPFMAYLKVIETYDGCMRGVWKPVEKQVAALRNTRLRTSSDELKLAKLEEQYRKKEEQTCKPDKLQVARAAFYEAMKVVNRTRRDRALQAVSTRLRQLFPGSPQ